MPSQAQDILQREMAVPEPGGLTEESLPLPKTAPRSAGYNMSAALQGWS